MSPRKLLLLGATGGTGREILAQALAAGHDVTVFTRTPDKIAMRHERLRLAAGRVIDDADLLTEAARGRDAVVSALGRGRSFRSTGLIARSVPVILLAMRAAGVRRLIFTSSVGVGDTIRDVPPFLRLMVRLLMRDIYADKAAGEALIRQSSLDWTLVQPVELTSGPLTRTYRVGERLALGGMPNVSRADVAHFILGQLDDTAYVGKVVLISR